METHEQGFSVQKNAEAREFEEKRIFMTTATAEDLVDLEVTHLKFQMEYELIIAG